MAVKRKVTETASLNNRSRISNGSQFLPCVHEQSAWARLSRDSYAEIVSDCGGVDHVPWTIRSTAKHTSVLSAELDFLAAKIGRLRQDDKEPEPQLLDLYTRLLNAERRQCEALGWERKQRDITSTIEDAIQAHRREATDVEPV